LAIALPACGKKAPLRLAEDRVAERAPAARARIREGRVTIDFQVPARRAFPEREPPWVLARVMRQGGANAEIVEAGAILKTEGFAFEERLSWEDPAVLPPLGAPRYRVEFRDAMRRRRALSEPLTVAWRAPPAAPGNFSTERRLGSIVLAWEPPEPVDGLAYRVYRRLHPGGAFELVTPEAVTGTGYVDSRGEPGRAYCYAVRGVIGSGGTEYEGPASRESCSLVIP
jgi:hypothetical protein